MAYDLTKLVEALQFYADPQSWHRPILPPDKYRQGSQVLISKTEEDKGRKAREALEDLGSWILPL